MGEKERELSITRRSIMGVHTFTAKIKIHVAPSKIFKAMVLDADTLLPKIVPQAIKNVEVIEGNRCPGPIKRIYFPEGKPFSALCYVIVLDTKSHYLDIFPVLIIIMSTCSLFKYVKHRLDALDKENMTYGYTIVEGDALLGKLESISYEFKLNSVPGGGSIGKNVCTYHTKPGAEINEEEIKAVKNMTGGIFKVVKADLPSHSDD